MIKNAAALLPAPPIERQMQAGAMDALRISQFLGRVVQVRE
jgi:hypothetical protein